MGRFLLRRLAFAAVLVFVVSSASLILVYLAPGDFVTESLGVHASAESIEQARVRYGLNRSLATQYVDWLGRAVQLDFGRSMKYDRPVADLIPERAKNTALLAFSALFVATVVGLPLGVIAATRSTVLSAITRPLSVLLL